MQNRSATFHRRARAPLMRLDEFGRLSLANLMYLFQCSHQTVYDRIRRGKYPGPDGYDGRRPFWQTSTVLPYFHGGRADE